jgi:predicted TIM-barrel fold metal-dependent hydrolase
MDGWMEDDVLFESWIAYQNDLAFKIVQARPDVFLGACQIPQRPHYKDTENCIEELERSVKELGFVAAYVSPDSTGKGDTPTMNMPYWFPVYEKCQELNIPIIVHGTDIIDPRYRTMNVGRYFELNFMGPQSIATVTLRHNPQIFERFPGLKIIVCHCGGFIDRIGEGAPYRAKANKLDDNLFYDSAAYDIDYLSVAIKQRGVSQIAFGTEAPGSGREIRPGTKYTADDLVPMFESHPALDFLTEAEKLDILHNMPIELVPGIADAVAQNKKAKAKAY